MSATLNPVASGSTTVSETPSTVIERRDLFVNWADFPSVIATPSGRLLVHWLQRSGAGRYAYDVRIAQSTDAGATWSADTLLHTDLAPHNVLVNDRAHIIDWAWPTRGAAWIDPAVLILRLLEAGHSLASADSVARQLPSWCSAPVRAVQAFAAANAAAWAEIARQDSAPWKAAMARHAVDLHTYVRTFGVS